MGATKSVRRSIHMQIGDLLEQGCNKCEYRNIGNRYTSEGHYFCSKECPVGQDLQKLSNQLIGDEKNKNNNPLVRSTVFGKWTEDEDFYLKNHYTHYSVQHLAKKFHRSPLSVKRRINHLIKKEMEAK